MNITSYLANKCFEFLLSAGIEKTSGQNDTHRQPPETSFISSVPPWVKNTDLFKRDCDGCGKCVKSCETGALILGKDNYPHVDFSRGPCTFCGKCSACCPQDILSKSGTDQPWDLTAFITIDCLAHNNVLCRSCIEHCDKGAIKIERSNGFLIVPKVISEKCNGCGACFNPCPVRAIKIISGTEEVKS